MTDLDTTPGLIPASVTGARVVAELAELQALLRRVEPAVGGRYVGVPILQGVHLAVRTGVLTASATDYEVGVSSDLHGLYRADEDCTVVVPFQPLKTWLGNLKRENGRAPVQVELDMTRRGWLRVIGGGWVHPIPVMPIDEWPGILTLDGPMPDADVVTGADMISALKFAATAAAPARSDLPLLTGIRFTIDQDGAAVAATDRYRMAQAKFDCNPSPGDGWPDWGVVLPAHATLRAVRHLSPGEWRIRHGQVLGSTRVLIADDLGTTLVLRCLDGDYPKVNVLWPPDLHTVLVHRRDLIEMCRSVGTIVERGTPLTLAVSGQTEDDVTVSVQPAQGYGAGAGWSTIDWPKDADDPGAKARTIPGVVSADWPGDLTGGAFMASFMVDALAPFTSEVVAVGFVEAELTDGMVRHPVVIGTSVDALDHTARRRVMVMPCRVAS